MALPLRILLYYVVNICLSQGLFSDTLSRSGYMEVE